MVDATTITSVVAAVLAGAPAGDSIYMKYGGIEGDVAATGHEGAIQLNSFQWGIGRGISSPGAGGGREASAPTVSEIVVTKTFDFSSVPLIREAFMGEDEHVDADFVRPVEGKLQTYLSFDLDNTLVSGYSMSSGGGLPSESLSLNFTRITIGAIGANGEPQKFTFDLAKQVAAIVPAAVAQAAPATSQTVMTASADIGGGPIYITYGNITGDGTAIGYEGAIPLNSFQWGVGRGISSPGAGGGREASAPTVSEIVVTKTFDFSSVPLIREAFIGEGTHAGGGQARSEHPIAQGIVNSLSLA